MLTIDKAIEVLTPLLREFRARCTPDQRDAIKLLIEAGKRLQKSRSIGQFMDMPLLPGETKE